VDHGKTSLVRALTGINTDRWREEQDRGLTIDIGFARLPLIGQPPDSGLEIGVVDVPGHEDFVKNMLAGATGIDLLLLVIAADEGPMPQTREHLAIAQLLGVRTGVVALTKADRVEDDWLHLAEETVREELRRTMSSALSYPAFLLSFSLGVIVFVLVVVFPKFADMFSSIRDDLPATTLVLMATSEFLIEHWMIVILSIVIGIATLIWWAQTPAGRRGLDQWKMSVVGLKTIFIQVYLIQSLRVIGLSLGNGVSITDALASSREVVANRVFQEFLDEVERKVVEGSGFAMTFQETAFVPATVKQMITTGESTGNLPRILGRVADYYERELDKKLGAFARLIEPLMLIVMGGIVGLIVSSLILPIFQLSRAVG